MEKFIRHIRLHVAAYFAPLIFAFALTAGGVGVFVAKIPAEAIQSGILKTFVLFAQSMSMHDDPAKKKKTPSKNRRVDELIKLEGRRRKNEWKDISEEFAWSWRLMDEGVKHEPDTGRYKIIFPERVWAWEDEPDGKTIQYDSHYYLDPKLHHWIIYFASLIGTIVFFHGFFNEITKSGF